MLEYLTELYGYVNYDSVYPLYDSFDIYERIREHDSALNSIIRERNGIANTWDYSEGTQLNTYYMRLINDCYMM